MPEHGERKEKTDATFDIWNGIHDLQIIWNYVEHPVESWQSPTTILYGSADNLTSHETIHAFAEIQNAELTVLKGGEHWFHTEEQVAFLEKWFDEKI